MPFPDFGTDESDVMLQLAASLKPVQSFVDNENNWPDAAAAQVLTSGGIPTRQQPHVTSAAPPPGMLMQAGPGLSPGYAAPRPVPVDRPGGLSDHGIRHSDVNRDPGPSKEPVSFRSLFKSIILAEMKEPK